MFHKQRKKEKNMNTLMLTLGLIWTIGFVLYTKKICSKTFNSKSKTILATIVAPIIILFLAIYTTASFVVGTQTRTAMLNDPEILTDTIKRLEDLEKEKQQEAAKEALKSISENDSKYAPIIGNPEGKVVAYAFFDYNCGYCKRGDAALTQLLETEKDVKVVLKSFPIFPPSQIPGRAIIAAKEQGKVAELHKALYETRLIPEASQNANEKDMNEKIKAIVFGAAQKAGLDVEKLKKDMEAPAVEEEILRTRQLAEKLGIQGTPAFIIGNEFFRGFVDTPVMMEAVQNAR